MIFIIDQMFTATIKHLLRRTLVRSYHLSSHSKFATEMNIPL